MMVGLGNGRWWGRGVCGGREESWGWSTEWVRSTPGWSNRQPRMWQETKHKWISLSTNRWLKQDQKDSKISTGPQNIILAQGAGGLRGPLVNLGLLVQIMGCLMEMNGRSSISSKVASHLTLIPHMSWFSTVSNTASGPPLHSEQPGLARDLSKLRLSDHP